MPLFETDAWHLSEGKHDITLFLHNDFQADQCSHDSTLIYMSKPSLDGLKQEITDFMHNIF